MSQWDKTQHHVFYAMPCLLIYAVILSCCCVLTKQRPHVQE